jgi:hypothetical protein
MSSKKMVIYKTLFSCRIAPCRKSPAERSGEVQAAAGRPMPLMQKAKAQTLSAGQADNFLKT